MEYLLEGLAAEAQRQGQQTRYKAYLTVRAPSRAAQQTQPDAVS
jgi:hypothetical protein